jgi:ribosomal protein L3 glutamine methyltransferase
MMFEDALVDAVDISQDALNLATENVSLHALDNVRLIQSDLFSQLASERYNLIVCNPPYVNAQSIRDLPPEFLHEPVGALAGGDDGMDLIRRLFQEAPSYLTPKGKMVLEIGHEYDYFVQAFPTLEVDWLTTSHGDYAVCVVGADALRRAVALEFKK